MKNSGLGSDDKKELFIESRSNRDPLFNVPSYDLTDSEGPLWSNDYDERDVIDCNEISALSLEEIYDDISDFDMDAVRQLKSSFKSYDDVSYWAAALLNQSPAGALLLKNAASYQWSLASDSKDVEGWSLDSDSFIFYVGQSDIKPSELPRSPYFLNTYLYDMIRALRDIWLEERNELDYAEYHPESVIKLERMRAADIECLVLHIAWELRSTGYGSLWRHLLGGSTGDMALIFSRFMERDPASLFDGSALTVAFKQWYADEDRTNAADRVALEMADDILLSADQANAFSNERIDHGELTEIFALPEGRGYLETIISDILKDPHYASMHDSINETHLYHIIRDMEVCYVGNVPFRDAKLADKIFPDYTKTLKEWK